MRDNRGRTFKEISFTCMDCGKECTIWEMVDIGMGEYEIWCYCKQCNVDTFHPLEYID